MGGLGSTPGWLLVLVAFVVLIILRFASLALVTTKPEAKREENGKVVRMAHIKSIMSNMAETTWAIGASTLAGLPPLT